MSKTKEIYHTFKRSISATANGLLKKNNQQQNTNCEVKWIHPPANLLNGKITYKVKIYGHIEVAVPKGSDVVSDAIHSISFRLSVESSTKNSKNRGLQKATIQISADDVTVIDDETNLILYQHPLLKISFCADDKADKRIFSYIAMEKDGKYYCYVFYATNKSAEDITLTIGQAFDLLLKKYIDKKSPKDMIDDEVRILKNRIAELETENECLKKENRYWKDKLFSKNPEALLPNTPVPALPPPNNGIINNLPPPPSGRPNTNRYVNINKIDIDLGGPQVSTKLDNIKAPNDDEIFDDNFDPRAAEKDPFGLDPFNVLPPANNTPKDKNYGDELEEMIAKCTDKINNFSMGTIESKDVDQLRRFNDDDESYAIPSSKINSAS